MCVATRLSEHPGNLSLEESAFMAIYCRQQQQKAFGASCRVLDIILLLDFNKVWKFLMDVRKSYLVPNFI
jgi:hypothetical protein